LNLIFGLADETGEPIEDVRVDLKDDTHYLIAVSVIPSSPELDPTMELLGFTPRDLDNYNRSIGHMLATNFALDSLENLGILEPRVTASHYKHLKTTLPLRSKISI
jgi:hypothetical protein